MASSRFTTTSQVPSQAISSETYSHFSLRHIRDHLVALCITWRKSADFARQRCCSRHIRNSPSFELGMPTAKTWVRQTSISSGNWRNRYEVNAPTTSKKSILWQTALRHLNSAGVQTGTATSLEQWWSSKETILQVNTRCLYSVLTK